MLGPQPLGLLGQSLRGSDLETNECQAAPLNSASFQMSQGDLQPAVKRSAVTTPLPLGKENISQSTGSAPDFLLCGLWMRFACSKFVPEEMSIQPGVQAWGSAEVLGGGGNIAKKSVLLLKPQLVKTASPGHLQGWLPDQSPLLQPAPDKMRPPLGKVPLLSPCAWESCSQAGEGEAA